MFVASFCISQGSDIFGWDFETGPFDPYGKPFLWHILSWMSYENSS